ncbi:uncharacterized protein LOC125679342 [Ostrea edulis]|uniref:uncharacterized protein LOC125679342 n=1 Tax=Ostrea edulis TaxID=37623 RepID=UPI0024AFDCEF|nr:uncharacterized protein LOC125679342 [Ostrea edulis]
MKIFVFIKFAAGILLVISSNRQVAGMKDTYWIILFSFSIAVGQNSARGLDFQYSSSGDEPCVHVILDASITLNLKNDTKTHDLPLRDARVSSGTCKSDRSELHVLLHKLNSLNFLFRKASDGQVSVSFKIVYQREGKTALILESDYSPISKSDEVYRCETTDAVLLHDDSGQNIGSLFISNVTMQAFGIQKGNFSEKVNTCAIDNTNSTLHPLSLDQNEDMTNDVTEFELRDGGGNVCTRLSGELKLRYRYEKKDGNMTTVQLSVPKTALVSGHCDKERVYLVLRYKEGGSDRVIVFYFSQHQNRTTLDNIETIIKIDSVKFPGAKFANAVLRSYARIGAQLGLENEFFGCQHQKQFLGTNFILKTRHLKIQTSSTGVPEKFSTARVGCPEDDVKMTDTQLFSLKDGNKTCLLLSGAFQMSIPFISRQKKSVTQRVNVPFSTSIDTSGNCSSQHQQEMTLSFYTDWKLRFVFVSTSASGATPVTKIIGYTLSNITLVYVRSPLIFYNPEEKSTGKIISTSSSKFDTPLRATSMGNYKCDDTIVGTMTDGGKLKIHSLRFQAFHQSQSNEFSGDVSTCNSPAKQEKRYAIYIIIALVVAAVIAVVIIAFVVATKRNQRSTYQHMD